ncbi:MAG: hypothetical protein LBS40_00885 [Burkholderiales bacterium]|nr:hypothetical protein [Burkholderiales bacterium]
MTTVGLGVFHGLHQPRMVANHVVVGQCQVPFDSIPIRSWSIRQIQS